MTASNLGPRVTGWGFVVFTVGSIGWCLVALASKQPNLLWTNGFLTLVNLVGVWRWLGRQARYADGGAKALAESAPAPSPTLMPLTRVTGAGLTTADQGEAGRIVDAMVRCDDLRLAYFVASDGGIGGLGERLYAVGAEEVTLSEQGVALRAQAIELPKREPIVPSAWPAQLSPAHLGR